jgi:hypothetical protein
MIELFLNCENHAQCQRLCLSATADYWVNAMDGRPLFVVSPPVAPGLLQVFERDLIPRLEQEVPNQPSSEKLDADPLLHRFTVGFDREGYSPAFLAKMKNRRIACGPLRSSKHPKQRPRRHHQDGRLSG